MGSWDQVADAMLAESEEESQKISEANECRSCSRSPSPDRTGTVPMAAQGSDSWWVQRLKLATTGLCSGPVPFDKEINVVSGCTAACAEAAVLAASCWQSGQLGH